MLDAIFDRREAQKKVTRPRPESGNGAAKNYRCCGDHAERVMATTRVWMPVVREGRPGKAQRAYCADCAQAARILADAHRIAAGGQAWNTRR